MKKLLILTLSLSFFFSLSANAEISVGVDQLFQTPKYRKLLRGKRIGLITNHTAINSKMQTTTELLFLHAKKNNYQVAALFAPEHGFSGTFHSEESAEDEMHNNQIPIYSLHGNTRRPTEKMLKGIDLLIFDIQDIGSRSYTYISTLFYVMEEAAKRKIPLIVADRPNPINGVTVDGPMLEEKWRSFVGYINIPYCYGMTIGELAHFFNKEYQVHTSLTVIPMKGWKRTMTYSQTGLPWIPTSPNIPEPTTAFYYPMTGILGELQIVNIGIGYTLPFKLVGAPWIEPNQFAKLLNEQKLPGVLFHPFHYKPFYGSYAHKECAGVFIYVTNPLTYLPVSTQYVILGLLKSLYPKEFAISLKKTEKRKTMFHKVNGTDKIYQILSEKPYIAWELRHFDEDKRNAFLKKRKKYLFKEYN